MNKEQFDQHFKNAIKRSRTNISNKENVHELSERIHQFIPNTNGNAVAIAYMQDYTEQLMYQLFQEFMLDTDQPESAKADKLNKPNTSKKNNVKTGVR
ncbi:hypothetical protein [Convivina intestini]|uniref:Uncharacterized protein n=1 Tax=Convivina intestini TaxID=1505726 RepID=A0A2U1D474_9LACO|nr:hypothetical protein [Convivina intestini]PVY82352.1 hypothetical protein C7384_1137 [Convivina intestini]CAH1854544.1 hypothetical protein R078131_00967 [Convivina intestini]CAH1857393.1 hypothetical protein R077811_01491 [Convivina intestini]SDC14467.1 hypothetical protein SAMN05216341_1157 [Leuconostocaceae bacterium R-53105]